jgi:GTPase
MIIDEVTITVEAGAGGNGCMSFRREKYIPRGGPDGGNGGRGGDVVLESRSDVRTLVDFMYRPLFEARHGEHGKGKNQHGHNAEAVVIRVPVGTMVWDENHELLADLNLEGMKVLIAKGGRGGRGNTTFATSTLHAPRLAEKGEPGEKKILRLELKMLADVGIVGFPNAGKSTLLSRITHAHPKIADYPFTTLEPQLGVVKLSGERSFVVADVPGLIEGASQGKGLGIRFLKHLERTKILLHLVELPELKSFAELEKRVKIIRGELSQHSPKFKRMSQILVLTKLDAASFLPVKDWLEKLRKKKIKARAISAVSGEGLPALLEETWKALMAASRETPEQPKQEQEKTVFQASPRYKIEKRPGGFRVSGAEIRKWVAMTNFEIPAAVERFQKILQRMGVLKDLKKMGVRKGNVVDCEGEELTFETNFLGASHES